ncbi:MAG: Gfo/Idh/MocA family oxidoreductase, partial [Kiritimatiellae bacterium]|nr:Gfo/Idh/MocA family oxidoreductase [Kiritimatiellia bacterium]
AVIFQQYSRLFGGAAGNLQEAAKIAGCTVKLVAFADFFLEKAEAANQKLADGKGKVFGGANGYKEIMKMPEVDLVILTTPLNFRPRHTMAAIQAGKHVFAEKGVAVDAPGVREMIAASKLAAEKKLTIVCGTQRRHQRGYLLQKKALDEGKISPILGGEVYWNGAVPWVREREAGMTNAAYLCNNWLNFTELSGDHICEQHVHNIDVANWFLGRYPKSVVAFGGRARRVSGNQFDYFSGDFDYGDGVHIHSMCRQIENCANNVSELFRTDKAVLTGQTAKTADGKKIELDGDYPDVNPYVQEHVDELKSILGAGPYLNEGEACAMSTACGVMLRISAYTGQMVAMNQIISNEKSPYYNLACTPTPADFEKDGDVVMPVCGDNEWALPGKPWRELSKDVPACDKGTQCAPFGYKV